MESGNAADPRSHQTAGFSQARLSGYEVWRSGNGKGDCTEAFRKAIAACNKAGGGRVVVPAGSFLTGPIHLKSNVNLHVTSAGDYQVQSEPGRLLAIGLQPLGRHGVDELLALSFTPSIKRTSRLPAREFWTDRVTTKPGGPGTGVPGMDGRRAHRTNGKPEPPWWK